MPSNLTTLYSNLRLLRRRFPGVHSRLNHKVVGTVLQDLYRGDDGQFVYSVQDQECRRKVLIKESVQDIDLRGKKVVILLGVGLGYQLFEIFNSLAPDQYLIAVETRPELLCKSMYVHNWEQLLTSERVRLFLGNDQQALSDLAFHLGTAINREKVAVLDNKVLVSLDQKLYSWWNIYFYLIAGLGYDGIRVINAIMSRFNIWDKSNLFLNLPSDFLGKQIAELKAQEVFGRFHLLAKVLEPGLRIMRLGGFPALKNPLCRGSVAQRVSIILLCWNKVEYTRRCLKSVLEHTNYPDFRVIAVDNGSTDRTREVLLSLAHQDRRVHPVLSDRNLGIPGGRQAGLEVADGEFILFLDNDTVIERPDYLKVMAETITSHPNIGSTGAFPIAYTHDRDDRFIQCIHVPGIMAPVAWCSGYCLMVRRRALEDIGGIDADMFEAYGAEDVYLGYKLRAHGWITVSTPDLVGVSHHIAHREDHYDYEWELTGLKNREFFFRNFGPRRRLLNAALNNRITAGKWETKLQKFC